MLKFCLPSDKLFTYITFMIILHNSAIQHSTEYLTMLHENLIEFCAWASNEHNLNYNTIRVTTIHKSSHYGCLVESYKQ